MNLNLLKKEKEDKTALQVYMYTSIIDELKSIAKKEDIKIQAIIRHLINSFLDQYRKEHADQPQASAPATVEVKNG